MLAEDDNKKTLMMWLSWNSLMRFISVLYFPPLNKSGIWDFLGTCGSASTT